MNSIFLPLLGHNEGNQNCDVEEKMPLPKGISRVILRVLRNQDPLSRHEHLSIDGVCLGVISTVAAREDNLLQCYVLQFRIAYHYAGGYQHIHLVSESIADYICFTGILTSQLSQA
jgi:hypothetical protein